MKITPVNVITGFLGVGKTSSILSLLHQKPVDEEWAILVNEFGEIGVDQGLIKGQIARGMTSWFSRCRVAACVVRQDYPWRWR